MTVVVKGSVTPKVSSCSWSDGSGPEAISSSRWFCQKQSARATPKTARQTISRLRSSSRCSTRVSSILVGNRPDSAGHRARLRTFVGDRLAARAASSLLRRSFVVVVIVVAADRAAELADPLAERAPQFGQSFRPEDDQGDDQDDRRSRVGRCLPSIRTMVTGARVEITRSGSLPTRNLCFLVDLWQ